MDSVPLLLWVAYIVCIRSVWANLSMSTYRPFGVRMCTDRCHQTRRCAALHFEEVDLHCKLLLVDAQQAKDRIDLNSTRIDATDKTYLEFCKLRNCSAGSHCLNQRILIKDCSQVNNHDDDVKVLIMPAGELANPLAGNIFLFSNDTIQRLRYPQFKNTIINTLVYISWQHNLLVCTDAKVMLCKMDGTCVELKKNYRVVHVAVDEGKQLLFVILHPKMLHSAYINKLTISMKKVGRIPIEKVPLQIALDVVREIAYVTLRFGKYIQSCPYQGVCKSTTMITFFMFITIDPVENALYFLDNYRAFHKKDLRNGDVKILNKTLGNSPHPRVHHGVLFVVCDNKLYLTNLESGSTSHLNVVEDEQQDLKAILCFIP